MGAAGPREDGEAAARRFLSWLADSGRPWLVVLDGLAMSELGTGCRQFRAMLKDRLGYVADVVGKENAPSVVACWSLAVERANELDPPGLAWPALSLAALLDPDGIPGQSLDRARLPAVGYWQMITDISSRMLRAGHDQAVLARGNLAHAYLTAGQVTDAVRLLEQTLADAERVLGPDDPMTRTLRENLEAL